MLALSMQHRGVLTGLFFFLGCEKVEQTFMPANSGLKVEQAFMSANSDLLNSPALATEGNQGLNLFGPNRQENIAGFSP